MAQTSLESRTAPRRQRKGPQRAAQIPGIVGRLAFRLVRDATQGFIGVLDMSMGRADGLLHFEI